MSRGPESADGAVRTERVEFVLSPKELEGIDALAKDAGCTRAALIRDACNEYVGLRKDPQPFPQQAKLLSPEMIGLDTPELEELRATAEKHGAGPSVVNRDILRAAFGHFRERRVFVAAVAGLAGESPVVPAHLAPAWPPVSTSLDDREPALRDLITAALERDGWPTVTTVTSNGLRLLVKGSISRHALEAFRSAPVTDEELRNLSDDEARKLYGQYYVLRPGFGLIRDVNLLVLCVGIGLTRGPDEAIRLLQKALGLSEDGQFWMTDEGALRPHTSALFSAVNAADERRLATELQLQIFVGQIAPAEHRARP